MADEGAGRELPLAGVVICCTGLPPEERTRIASVAAQMGAAHTFDLTANVTHLLASSVDTEKYRYVARERSDMKVLDPSFIDAVRIQWMSGGDANIQQLEEEFKYPTFQGTKICVTGWDDYAFRLALEQQLKNNGAIFQRDLTREATHLVAKAPTGKKFEFATLWGNIKVVSIKWVEDSLARGMVLDEYRYHPSMPVEQQGVGAWKKPTPPSMDVPPKRTNPVAIPQRARKIRRVASMKLGSQTEDLWGAIMAVGNNADTTTAAKPDVWTDNYKDVEADRNQFIQGEEKQDGVLTGENSAAATNAEDSTAAQTSKSSRSSPQPESRGIWYGCRFFIYGFTTRETGILVKHMTFHDAEIVKTSRDLSPSEEKEPKINQRYIIVPFTCPRHSLPSVDDLEPKPKFVNDLWIEKCLHQNKFFPPEEHVACTPFNTFPISGAKYVEYLTPKTSVLVCNSGKNREKLRHVAKWNIPAVSADWMWDSVRSGVRQPYEKYLLQKWEPTRKSLPSKTDSDRKDSATKDLQGKTTDLEPQGSTEREKRLGPFVISQEDSINGDHSAPKNHHSSIQMTEGLLQDRNAERASSEKRNGPSPQTLRDSPATETTKEAVVDGATSRSALDNAINTLLRISSKESSGEMNESNGRRRRRLFGRANSNASSTLTGHIAGGRSREQSVDTANGDANGNNETSTSYKLERDFGKDTSSDSLTRPSHLRPSHLESATTDSYMADFDDDEEEQSRTQLRYQDPDAAALKAVMLPKTVHDDESGVNKIFDAEAQKQRERVAAKLKEGEVKQELLTRRRTRSSAKLFPA
ncbi:hypothetical protein KEM54_004967 [Ascosphaera aggregata]|nr:hypothetical protein KEM54_004967 [Ascosphaera aggregata]